MATNRPRYTVSVDDELFQRIEDGSSTLVRNIKHYKPQKCGLFYVKFYLFLCCMALFYML